MTEGSPTTEAEDTESPTSSDAPAPSPGLFASTTSEPAAPALVGDDLLTPTSSAQLIGSLALVLAVIVALGWLSRRLHRLQPRRGNALQVLDVLPVGARERVALVKVGSTQLVLGLAPGRVQTLHVLEGDSAALAADEASSPTAESTLKPFASLLKR